MKTTHPLLFLAIFVAAGCAQFKTAQIQNQSTPLPAAEVVARPIPIFTYAFDDSFLHYFGHEGTMHVHSAVQRALSKGLTDIEEIRHELDRDTTLQLNLQEHNELPALQLLPDLKFR